MVSCRLFVNNLNDTEILSESWRMLNQEMKASDHHKLKRPMFGFIMVLTELKIKQRLEGVKLGRGRDEGGNFNSERQ